MKYLVQARVVMDVSQVIEASSPEEAEEAAKLRSSEWKPSEDDSISDIEITSVGPDEGEDA